MGNKYKSIEQCNACNDNDFIVIANGETGVECYCTNCGVYQWTHTVINNYKKRSKDGVGYNNNANKNS